MARSASSKLAGSVEYPTRRQSLWAWSIVLWRSGVKCNFFISVSRGFYFGFGAGVKSTRLAPA
jgi:hypothetical protein